MSILPQPAQTDNKILTLLAHASLGRRLLPTVWIMDDGRCSCMLREAPGDERVCSRNKAGKHPRISEWQKRASCDPDQIVEWHRWQPLANWGWLQDQTFTLDVDVKRGGLKSLTQWEEEAGGPAYTLRQRTQSGGLHLIYAQPDESAGGVIRVQGDILPGIEIRGLGSYIMVDPSTGWTLENPDILPAEPDELTLQLIYKHGIDPTGYGDGVEKLGLASGNGEKNGKKSSSGKSSNLPATLWFMENGFGGYSGSRNVDAYRLAWRVLRQWDPGKVVEIMKICWLATEQGESHFGWDECLGAINSAWIRMKRQDRENEKELRARAASLVAGGM